MLPKPPAAEVETRRTLPSDGAGFLTLERRRCVVRYPDGEVSEEFTYDHVLRRSMHASVIVAHYVQHEEPFVFLRSCLRPPLGFHFAQGGAAQSHALWELPAGLVDEPGELLRAARSCAQRELLEEVGIDAPVEDFRQLGTSVYPVPAMIAEQQFFFEVSVDPATRRVPTEDGSPLERNGSVFAVSVREALEACRRGVIPDSKTELGLRRFWERWQDPK